MLFCGGHLRSMGAAGAHACTQPDRRTCPAAARMPHRDTLIGSTMVKGISGGQAKRTNIGIALVTNPRILFLGASWEEACAGAPRAHNASRLLAFAVGRGQRCPACGRRGWGQLP